MFSDDRGCTSSARGVVSGASAGNDELEGGS
jgi:hypothetical protein